VYLMRPLVTQPLRSLYAADLAFQALVTLDDDEPDSSLAKIGGASVSFCSFCRNVPSSIGSEM
jgi:hypothetical protein